MLTFEAILAATRSIGTYGEGRARTRPDLPSRTSGPTVTDDGEPGYVRAWNDEEERFEYVWRGLPPDGGEG